MHRRHGSLLRRALLGTLADEPGLRAEWQDLDRRIAALNAEFVEAIREVIREELDARLGENLKRAG
jgi:hypothetical protein